MREHLIVIILMIVFSLSQPAPRAQEPPAPQPEKGCIVLTIDSTTVKHGAIILDEPPVAPLLINNRTMLPFRYLCETIMQGVVHFEEAEQKIIAFAKGHVVVMYVDNPVISVDGVEIMLSQAPVIVDGHTLVPLRAFETVVASIVWKPETQRVEITLSDPPAGSYQPIEILDWQEDPSTSFRPQWDHVEYRLFSEKPYNEHKKMLPQFQMRIYDTETRVVHAFSSAGGPNLMITYLLPAICDDGHGIIQFDLGFEQGAIKMGEFPPFYFELDDPLELAQNYYYEGERVTEWIETQENLVGGMYKTEKFIRAIYPQQRNTLVYIVKLNEKNYVQLYFYVSPDATTEDLALYDMIVDTIELK